MSLKQFLTLVLLVTLASPSFAAPANTSKTKSTLVTVALWVGSALALTAAITGAYVGYKYKKSKQPTLPEQSILPGPVISKGGEAPASPSNPQKVRSALITMQQDIDNIIRANPDTIRSQNLIDDYLNNLKQKFPQLTPPEIQQCGKFLIDTYIYRSPSAVNQTKAALTAFTFTSERAIQTFFTPESLQEKFPYLKQEDATILAKEQVKLFAAEIDPIKQQLPKLPDLTDRQNLLEKLKAEHPTLSKRLIKSLVYGDMERRVEEIYTKHFSSYPKAPDTSSIIVRESPDEHRYDDGKTLIMKLLVNAPTWDDIAPSIQRLIDLGSSVNAKDNNNLNALMLAYERFGDRCKGRTSEAFNLLANPIKVLLENGANKDEHYLAGRSIAQFYFDQLHIPGLKYSDAAAELRKRGLI